MVKKNRVTFKIPLISAFMGILMNRVNYRLIPLIALKNIKLEITLNEYAVFSGGYWYLTRADYLKPLSTLV